MRPAAWLFLAFTALYLFTGGGHFYASDDVQKLAVLDALADRHSIAIQDGWVVGAGGLRYAWFPPGASLVMLPGWALGRLVAWLAPGLPAVFVVRFCVAMQNAAISGALVALLYVLARRLGATRAGALLAAGGLGLGTMVWPYAKTAWSEPATALALYAALAALGRARETSRAPDGWLLAAGGALALAVTIRQEMLLPAAGACAWWAWQARGRGLLPLAAPLGLAIVACLGYDAWRYGTPFGFPSYNLPKQHVIMAEGHFSWSLRNLYQYTLSPNQGIVWYSPMVLAGLLGLPRLPRRMAGLVLAALAPLALFYMIGWGLSSWAWGLRYAYVFLPALVLPVAWAPRRASFVALALGVAVQLLAILHNPLELYERELARTPGLTIQQLVLQPAHAPLWLAIKDAPETLARGGAVLAGRMPPAGPARERRAGLPDVWWILALVEGVPRWRVALGAALLAALTLAAGLGLGRGLRLPYRNPGV
jgi:hypothetical protein